MLSRARRRRLAAHSATCVAGVALAAAPAATAADVGAPEVPVPLPPGAAPPAVPHAAASGACGGAGARAGQASATAMRRALHCLLDRQRARHGRHSLGADRRLGRAARRHAADMARRHYFSHISPSGSSPLARARAAGWHGAVGEAIAWGCGELSTPAATMRAWMASRPHRAILLGPAHAVGIGFKRASGCGGRGYWVVDVG